MADLYALAWLNPALIFFAGGLLVMVTPRSLRPLVMILTPLVSLGHLLQLPYETGGVFELLGFEIVTLRVDKIAFVFGLIFHLAAFLNGIYGWHEKRGVPNAAALMYAGAAVGAVFSGDLISLFVFWEITAVTSVFLIWARGTDRSMKAGIRYVIIQVFSGVLLLEGIILNYKATGSIAFDVIALDNLGAWLIFAAVGIKCAFPLLHNWLQDAYPEASVVGAVVLSAFTTKLAVYTLWRMFPGVEALIYIGAVMTAFPVFYAVIENDLRKVLAYSLNNQLGFMVVGVGIGTEMALNGTAAHAFVHILYKALLFMGMGAVLYRTGTTKASELGGLYKSMPLTALFTIIGGMSISAFPLFSGFVAKSLVMTAAGNEHLFGVWLVLVFASAGVLEHSGIKIPYFAFFGHDSGKRVKEAPFPMLLAMGATAFLCIAIGVYPQMLYGLLPFEMEYQPYTVDHVIWQLELLVFAVLAFAVLQRTHLYPSERASVNLDFDWTYRRAAPAVIGAVVRASTYLYRLWETFLYGRARAFIGRVYVAAGPDGRLARTWPTGLSVLWIAVLLVVTLLVSYA